MGFGYDVLSKINPRLIYCSITGEILLSANGDVELTIFKVMGRPDHMPLLPDTMLSWPVKQESYTGPSAPHFTLKVDVQCSTNCLRSTGEADRLPVRPQVAVSDHFAGFNACGAILAALIARRKTGKGMRIDVSMFDSQVCSSLLDSSVCSLIGYVGVAQGSLARQRCVFLAKPGHRIRSAKHRTCQVNILFQATARDLSLT
jgi:hypothetical protein